MRFCSRAMRVVLFYLLIFSRCANAKPAIEVNLASKTAWTFEPAGETVAKPMPVPAGGWRLNGFPAVTAGAYERKITIPQLPGRAAQTTFLEFEAVNWEAIVYAGTDRQHLQEVGRHLSAWTPFRVDISKALAPGVDGMVRVEVRDRTFFRDEKGSFTVPAATEWNDRQGRGILRGVALRVYPAVYIADIFVRPFTSRGTFTYEVSLVNSETRQRRVSVSGALGPGNPGARWTYPAIPLRTIALGPGESRTLSVGPLPWTPGRSSWWWPNVPFHRDYHAQLHNLTISLREAQGDAAGILQAETVRFGFCTPGQSGAYYTLNGTRINLRGDSLPESTIGTDAFARLPGFLPPGKGSSGWPGAVRNYQRLNYNVVRMHQIPGTRYMMNVCDELGLLVIPETAIRGGGGQKENIERNPDAYVTHLRELVLRDRNHPSVFKWSLENELFGAPEPFIRKLYDACRAADSTRPCSVDDGVPGVDADYPSYPGFAVIEHYSQPPGTPDAVGGKARTDRPFGQGEYVWPAGSTPRGPVWFSLTTRSLRAHNNADIRPYTLIDVWPGVIPGLTPTDFPLPHLPPDSLEQGGHSLIDSSGASLDPWQDWRIQLMQRSFAPIAAYDMEFDTENTPSNGIGDWPFLSAILTAGRTTARHLLVFNDTFAPADLTVQVQPILLLDADKPQPLPPIVRTVRVSPGDHTRIEVPVTAPSVTENRPLTLLISVSRSGQEEYRESVACAVVPERGGTHASYVDQDDKTQGDWSSRYGKQGFLIPISNGVSNFQASGILLQRGVGFLPDRASRSNLLNYYPPVQSAEIQWTNQKTTEDVRVPVQGPGLSDRVPIAFKGEGGALLARVNTEDNKPHRLSLYLVDFLRKNLTADIDILDLRGNRLVTRHVVNFSGGVYERFQMTGSVVVRITSADSDPSQLGGLFIDPAE